MWPFAVVARLFLMGTSHLQWCVAVKKCWSQPLCYSNSVYSLGADFTCTMLLRLFMRLRNKVWDARERTLLMDLPGHADEVRLKWLCWSVGYFSLEIHSNLCVVVSIWSTLWLMLGMLCLALVHHLSSSDKILSVTGECRELSWKYQSPLFSSGICCGLESWRWACCEWWQRQSAQSVSCAGKVSWLSGWRVNN